MAVDGGGRREHAEVGELLDVDAAIDRRAEEPILDAANTEYVPHPQLRAYGKHKQRPLTIRYHYRDDTRPSRSFRQ